MILNSKNPLVSMVCINVIQSFNASLCFYRGPRYHRAENTNTIFSLVEIDEVSHNNAIHHTNSHNAQFIKKNAI